MKNYAVLEGMKRQSKDVIECAFNKGYEQGYQDGKGERETEYKEALHNIENTYIKGQKASHRKARTRDDNYFSTHRSGCNDNRTYNFIGNVESEEE